ncbi:benzoate diol dehydrogenase BenD [Halomonas sp. NO4]|uniref:benzoate diol dehydrogenase BenD n=1 Tax=Halomonas sp. NO4 TaxID=2484813 RepID=UPI0013D3A10F|nr:benzoate diol dehydrogenase BenD [Halomonas sp. NO4]
MSAARFDGSRFQGRVMVITGAAQGIGRRVAERAGAEGARLALVDRADLVHEVVAGLREQGVEAIALQADLETWEGAADVMTRTVEHFGRLDILINNVGGAIHFKPFTEFSSAEISAEITRSLMPTLWCCRAALPTLVAQGSGVIVNVSSAATRGIHRIPYSAAKGGINALTASLAFEVAEHGIRVVATAPGGTEAPPRRISRGTPAPRNATEQAWFQAHVDQTKASCLMDRYGTLDEMAAPILFLASDAASYITGSVLPVAGGDQG